MGTYGIQTQTPHEVEPVQIWPPKELVKVYEHLGLSKRLGLQVFDSFPMIIRFKRLTIFFGNRADLLDQSVPLALAKYIVSRARQFCAIHLSSRFRISICRTICLCWLMILRRNYTLLGDTGACRGVPPSAFLFERNIWGLLLQKFIVPFWKIRKIRINVSQRFIPMILLHRDPQFKEMLELLAMLKKGHCDGLKVRTGRLQNLISSSCIGMLVFHDYYTHC